MSLQGAAAPQGCVPLIPAAQGGATWWHIGEPERVTSPSPPPARPRRELTSTSLSVSGLACQFTPGSRRGNSLCRHREAALRAGGQVQLPTLSGQRAAGRTGGQDGGLWLTTAQGDAKQLAHLPLLRALTFHPFSQAVGVQGVRPMMHPMPQAAHELPSRWPSKLSTQFFCGQVTFSQVCGILPRPSSRPCQTQVWPQLAPGPQGFARRLQACPSSKSTCAAFLWPQVPCWTDLRS